MPATPPMSIESLLAGDPSTVLFILLTIILSFSVTSVILKFQKKSPGAASSPGPVALSTMEFRSFTLSKKEIVSHDTRRFTFDLQTPSTRLGLTIGQHITLRFADKSSGRTVQRSYTPITGDEVLGKVTFVIKVYKAGVHPKFPDGGKMSQHLDSLEVGDTVDMRGPRGHMTYKGNGGNFTLKLLPTKPPVDRRAKHFGMIAGGTGITPMYQLMQAVVREDSDKSITISLLYANQSVNDILIREELEAFAKKHADRFKLHYTVDRAPEDGSEWNYSTGFVTKEMIEKYMPPKDPNGNTTQILMCGPPAMINLACLPNLKDLGYTSDDWFVF